MAMIPIVGGSGNGPSPSFDASWTVNLYPHGGLPTARTHAMLIGTPGLELWATLTGGAIKGLINLDGNIAIAVAGTNVWRLTTGAASTLIGTIAATSAPAVSMSYNGLMVMLVTGSVGYFIDPVGGVVTHIVDPNFTGADRVDFVDGYFVFNKPDTGQFQITQLYGTVINPLDFATAEGSPDDIVSLIVDHREVWLLGRNSTEIWIDNGNVDFPFGRVNGAFLEIGCAASLSVAKMDNSIFWLASDDRGFGTIQRAVGYAPQRVSTDAIETAINGYAVISDAVAYTYSQEGHAFYVISFPTQGSTWVYDAATGAWHERGYLDPSTGLMGRHRSNCQMNFAGKTLVGDWENGNIYRMGLDVYSDNGDPMESIRRFSHIAGNGNLQMHHALQVFMQPAVGLAAGQGSNPQAMLKWSDDGGYTWSNEHWVSIGKIGEYRARAKWRRLGRTRDRVYHLSISDPVKRIIIGADLEATGGKV
jgi:hypothetical protein